MSGERYKTEASNYWNNEYRSVDWKVVHNAGSKEKTIILAEREMDLFLTPTKEKCEVLLEDKDGNPFPTFTPDYWKHPAISDFIDMSKSVCLDFGCGSLARYSMALSKYFHSVFGVDVSSEAISKARQTITQKNIFLSVIDGVNLRFPPNFFDFIFSNLVLQHIGDLNTHKSLVSEFARVLKPGGVFRLEYLDGSQRKPDWFTSVVEGTGFSVQELTDLYAQQGIRIVCGTEGHPYTWITGVKDGS